MTDIQREEFIRVRTLVQAFEEELHELATLAETAQTTLSNVLSRAADDPACHRDAQVLDLLTQRLFGLSSFLSNLSPNIPRLWHVDTSDAAKAISLGALVERLNGAQVAKVLPDIGELEMF